MLTIRAIGNTYAETRATPVLTEVTGRRVEFDYPRAFVIVLVLWHQAILAYTAFAFLNPENPVETFSPVVDNHGIPVLRSGSGDIWAGRIHLAN